MNFQTSDSLLRCYFALTCNGFDSGIYGYLSIFNHSEFPNCIKFPPTKDVPYSEIRTIRKIEKGEHLTISYMNPREQSINRRRKYFLSQHNFDISTEISNLPVVIRFDETDREYGEVDNVERSMDEFDRMFREIRDVLDEANKAGTGFALEVKETLSLKCRDLYAASQELLGGVREMFTVHVLVIRCLRLHTNVAAAMLELAGTKGKVLVDDMEVRGRR